MIIDFEVGNTIDTPFGPSKIVRHIKAGVILVKDPEGVKRELNVSSLTDYVKVKPHEDLMANISPEEDPDKVKIAEERLKMIRAFDAAKKEEKKSILKEYGVGQTTIYRWKKMYESSGLLSALYPHKPTGGKDKVRVADNVDKLITQQINQYYLTAQKPKVSHLIQKVWYECKKQGYTPPHESTIRRRVKALSSEEKHKKRYGRESAESKYEYQGNSFKVNYPLEVVEIDHTILDIMLVTDQHRQPLGRPTITLAIDVYSRMVVGYYVSFDPAGSIGTGLCVSNLILDKEKTLDRLEITGEWPCWGVPTTLHLDNAKEFKGALMVRACKEYDIDIHWRGLGKTNWGGHVERFFRTLNEQIYDLPGTTFGDIDKRENYNSEKEAVLTLFEFEQWMVTYIVNIYHVSMHDGIDTSPMRQWEIGVIGDGENLGIGLKPLITDRRKVEIDFLPSYNRTIQRYGVKINNICYYSDLLRLWISSGKQMTFKMDPRDISCIYFWNPELEEYMEIPYAHLQHPPMSIWEYRKCVAYLKKLKAPQIDEDKIFEAYDQMQEIKSKAIDRAKNRRKATKRNIQKQKKNKTKVEGGLFDGDIQPLKIIE